MRLRTRLVLVGVATLAVGLGVLVIGGNLLLAARADSERSSVLHARAQAQIAALTLTRSGVQIRSVPNDELLDRQSWVLDNGRVIERPAAAPSSLDRFAITLGRAGRRVQRSGPGGTRLLAQPVTLPNGLPSRAVVVVALAVDPQANLQREVLIGSIVLALLVMLAGALAIRTAVGGALRPVAVMTASAEEWGAHDLDHRFNLGPPRDEFTGLAATLDGLLARIAASRLHEQRFAGDVAHELRTPIAALRGRAELALMAQGADADAERVAALRAVVDQSDRVAETVDTLLSIARRDIDPQAGSVDLGSLARELDDVSLTEPPGLPAAAGDRDVVRRAIAPIVDNAHRHARSRVEVELSAGDDRVRLAVHDDGPGIAADEVERIFEPGVRGNGPPSDGAGLGLALARRLARTCGGDVVAHPGSHGCVVLELPAVGPTPARSRARRLTDP